MKNLLILLSIFMISTSCETPESSQVIGFSINNDGERSDITIEADITDIWLEYIDAHNDRDYVKIGGMNSEDIQVWGPAGQYIEGKEAHVEFVSATLLF